MNLYRIGNQIINGDHIIRVQYTPEETVAAHIDKETDQPVEERVVYVAKIIVTTTEMELDEAYHYDGEVYGVASKSKEYCFKDTPARLFFELLAAHSIEVAK